MTAVTVELEDLETIVFATGVIKTIEGALASRRNDPFVREHLDYAAAHDRLATAMRNATRAAAGTLVPFDEPLTKTEVRALRDILEATKSRKDGVNLPWFRVSGPDKAAEGEKMSIYDRLAAKGCVRVGQAVTGVIFAGENRPLLVPDADRGYLVEITNRGRAVLTASEAERGPAPSTVLGAG